MRLMKTGNKSIVPANMPGTRRISLKEGDIETIGALSEKDDFVIKMWISTIDKIIAKPFEKDKENKPFKDSAVLRKAQQHREDLGDEAWDFLKSDFLLSVFRDGEFETEEERAAKEKLLKNIWDIKISATQKGRIKRDDFPQGRLYDDFVSVPIEKYGKHLAEKTVAAINSHLNIRARKYKSPQKGAARTIKAGLTEGLCKGFDRNTLHNAQSKQRVPVSREAWGRYIAKAGANTDIAALIKARILQEQDAKSDDKLKEFPLAVEVLREQIWEKIFGNAKSYSQALGNENGAELLAVHNAVKDAYKRLLKGRSFFPAKLKPQVSGKKDWQEQIKSIVCGKLEQILPADNEALFRLVAHKQGNQELNALIRLGKILHYTASKLSKKTASEESFGDSTAAIIAKWGDAVEAAQSSFYWSSAGQTQIKQSEAFVRVWRRALAFAAHNVKDWADPSNELGKGEDILLKKDKAWKNYCPELSGKKFELLFADKKLQSLELQQFLELQKESLRAALEGISALRNAAFHFKGLKTFIKAFKKNESLEKIWIDRYSEHLREEQKRLKKNFETIGLPYFIGRDDARALWHFVGGNHVSLLPLPRLRRVLERAENAWKGGKQGKTHDGKNLMPEIELPNYVSAQDREHDEAANCQWAVLKMLYDGAFKTWLDNVSHENLQNYIDHAVKRATWAARSLNSKDNLGRQKSDEERLLTIARSARLKPLAAGDTIESFFYHLTEETAQEMRVQKGYDSDGKNAQQQAKFIEDLKCDVVALALAEYLREQRLGFVLKLDKKPKSESPHFGIDALEVKEQEAGSAEWQAQLYFLLHFIPVEEANSLRMQIRKYQIVIRKTENMGEIAHKDRAHLQTGAAEADKAIAEKLVRVLDLYIFMHDAQYVGDEKNSIAFSDKEIGYFYHNEGDWGRVFPPSTEKQGETAAVRDLRELRRFGGFEFLKSQDIAKISSEQVTEWGRDKKAVTGKEGLHKQLQDLHDDWKQNRTKPQWQPEKKGKFPKAEGAKFAEYRKVLAQVAQYRDLTAAVMLQNPLRLHRLLMAVIGRLIDFGGLWERDLYFTMLALLYEKQQAELKAGTWSRENKENYLKKQFSDKANKLRGGQVVSAVEELNADNKDLRKRLYELFSIQKVDKIRDRFAHLAMLERANLPVNLTQEINYARELMSYDRKLKNAVSKSIKDLLEREKLKIIWEINTESGAHNLHKARLDSETDYHLKKTKTSASKACVPHYSEDYVAMVQALF